MGGNLPYMQNIRVYKREKERLEVIFLATKSKRGHSQVVFGNRNINNSLNIQPSIMYKAIFATII